MRRTIAIACAAAALAAAGAAPAAPAAARRASLPAIPLPDPMPEIIIGDCPGMGGEVAGCFFAAGEGDVLGRVYPHGGVYSIDRDRFTLLHELGRAFDATMMDAGERSRFAEIIGREDEVWSSTYTDEQGRVIEDPRSLAGVFGNAYANCRMRHIVASGHTWEAGYNYYPTARQHREVCGLIARAALTPGVRVAADGYR